MKEPPFLLSLFKPYKSDKPTRGVRKDLKIPSSITTDWGINYFQVKYVHFWNNIPKYVNYIHSHVSKKVLDNIYIVEIHKLFKILYTLMIDVHLDMLCI